MIVTPFGDLDYKSKPMSLQWLAAHGTRHETLRKALSRNGISLSPAPLFSQVSLEWVRLHYLHHMGLLRLIIPDRSISSQALSADPMGSEAQFQNWHRMHNLLHTRLDQALQVH
jgi:hypothetical protein